MDEIKNIKKDANYIKLITSNRNREQDKLLEKYRLRIAALEARKKKETVEFAPPEPQKTIKHPENPAKRRRLRSIPTTIDNKNRKIVINLSR